MVVLPPVFSSVPRPGRRRAPPTRPLLHLQVSSRSPNTLRLTDSRGRREAGEGGARASDLRELSMSGTLCPLRGGQGPLSAGWLVFLGAAGSPGGRGARVCPAGRLPLCPDLGPSASPLAWLRLCSQGEVDGLQPAGVGWAVAANSWGSGTSRGSRCPACKESLFLTIWAPLFPGTLLAFPGSASGKEHTLPMQET